MEAAFVFGLVGVMIYGITMLLLRAGEQRRPSPRSGTWRVVHYDARFLAAMDTARQRRALFEAEDRA